MTIDDIITNVVLKNEGGYVNNAADPGGETNFGITKATARAQGYAGDMRNMPRAFAIQVYRKQYATGPGFDKIGQVSMPVAALLIDIGVNMGPKTAGVFLQRALNALNEGSDYPSLTVDGNISSGSIVALTTYLKKRGSSGESVILFTIDSLRAERYVALCEAKGSNKAFAYGWLRRASSSLNQPINN